jgi:hypothetical protein
MIKDLIPTLKVGDKIICDKAYFHSYKGAGYMYNTGDVYNITRVGAFFYPIFAEHEYKKYYAHGFTEKELENNWITIAEFRDKQINSILND